MEDNSAALLLERVWYLTPSLPVKLPADAHLTKCDWWQPSIPTSARNSPQHCWPARRAPPPPRVSSPRYISKPPTHETLFGHPCSPGCGDYDDCGDFNGDFDDDWDHNIFESCSHVRFFLPCSTLMAQFMINVYSDWIIVIVSNKMCKRLKRQL